MFLQYGLALVVAWLAFAPQAPEAAKGAKIQTKDVEYRQGGTVLKGFTIGYCFGGGVVLGMRAPAPISPPS